MNIRKILIVALFCFSLPAAAEFTTIAEAYELSLADVQVPATPSSGIVFRKCTECDMQVVRVTPNTQYLINGKNYTLKEFRERVFNIRNRAETFVSVVHHLEADVVLSVSVFE
ncbi:MAG: hypothetical protein OEV41_09105 [Gammaproteobacteria bacterium]|nr:hypothetical protein [Gammaproteobacteria bacterium]MDH5344779.1 hypothetical protein [Gammaproteobacteria bacterium]